MANIVKINLTPSNSNLVPLFFITSANSYEKFTVSDIEAKHPTMAKAVKRIFAALTNKELVNDAPIVTAQYKSGGFTKAFGPGLYRDAETNELYIDIAGHKIPLVLTKQGITIPSANLEVGELEYKLVLDKPFDNGTDLYLKVTLYLEASQTTLAMYVLVRRADIKAEIDIDGIETMAKRYHDDFKALIGTAPTGTAFDGPMLKLADLQEGATYQVIGYRGVTTAYGQNYIMRLAPNSEAGVPVLSECWSNSVLKAVMDAKPIATEEQPMQLLIISITTKTAKNGSPKTTVAASLQPTAYETLVSNDLDLDF